MKVSKLYWITVNSKWLICTICNVYLHVFDKMVNTTDFYEISLIVITLMCRLKLVSQRFWMKSKHIEIILINCLFHYILLGIDHLLSSSVCRISNNAIYCQSFIDGYSINSLIFNTFVTCPITADDATLRKMNSMQWRFIKWWYNLTL